MVTSVVSDPTSPYVERVVPSAIDNLRGRKLLCIPNFVLRFCILVHRNIVYNVLELVRLPDH